MSLKIVKKFDVVFVVKCWLPDTKMEYNILKRESYRYVNSTD
jgi:hypothetical protein